MIILTLVWSVIQKGEDFSAVMVEAKNKIGRVHTFRRTPGGQIVT